MALFSCRTERRALVRVVAPRVPQFLFPFYGDVGPVIEEQCNNFSMTFPRSHLERCASEIDISSILE